MAIGFINEPPQIESAELVGDFQIPVPEKRCEKGHYEWFLDADGHYRCAHCKRDRTLRALVKKASEIQKAQQKPAPPQPKKRVRVGSQWRTTRALAALKEQVEQRRLERALKIVHNRIKKEQRCRILPTR